MSWKPLDGDSDSADSTETRTFGPVDPAADSAATSPETASPGAAASETAKPDAAKPETAKPETAVPEAAKPDTTKPGPAKPEADAARPEPVTPELRDPAGTQPPRAQTPPQPSGGYQAQTAAASGGNPLDSMSPEKAVAVAFAGGFVLARILKKIRG